MNKTDKGRKKYDKTKILLLRGSSASCAGCGGGCDNGTWNAMRDYVDMFICLVGYLTAVIAIGAIIGWVTSL